ncbi:hypothetical protein ACFW04_008231 [Cataglyphis niger]
MKFIYIVLIIIAWTSAELETWDIIEIKNRNVNINKLVDRFNPAIVQIINKYGLDPLKLPQTEQKLWMEDPNFSEPMIYKADVVLHSGILNGLSILKRHNNATLTYIDKLLKMDIGFEFELLKGRYDYIVKLVFQNIRGRIKVLAENIRAVINITFNTTNYTLALNKFDLQVPSRIKVTVENKDGSMDWINTIIINIIEASNAIQTYFNEINHKIAPRKTSAQILNQLLNQSL